MSARVVVRPGHIVFEGFNFSFDRPFRPCPEDFKKAMAEKYDWDYAIEASGPSAGLVQDALQLYVIQQITQFTTQRFKVDVAS